MALINKDVLVHQIMNLMKEELLLELIHTL